MRKEPLMEPAQAARRSRATPIVSGPVFELDPALKEKLRVQKVTINAPDENTIVLKGVPTSGAFFNKALTNILIKKLPCALCVDADLEYLGDDPILTRAFEAAVRHNGWRVLCVRQESLKDPAGIIREALAAVGFDTQVPTLRPALLSTSDGRHGLLFSLARSLTLEIFAEEASGCVGRAETIEAVLTSVLQWQPRLPVLVGASGVGKTHLLRSVAQRLSRLPSPLEVYAVNLGRIMAGTLFEGEREKLLASLLDEASDRAGIVLALECLEQAISGVPRGPLILAEAMDAGTRAIATSVRSDCRSFHTPPLARRINIIEVPEMGAEESLEALSLIRARLSGYHHVEIDACLLPAVVQRSTSLLGSLPHKAIALLDAAAARARLLGASKVALEDVYLAASQFGDEPGGGLADQIPS